MTILETFIKLRDDLKLWVTNNLNTKANISYVDTSIENIPAITTAEIDAICGAYISAASEVEV